MLLLPYLLLVLLFLLLLLLLACCCCCYTAAFVVAFVVVCCCCCCLTDNEIATHPSWNVHSQFIPRAKCTMTAAVTASATQDTNARRTHVNFSLLRASVFKPSPERIRITTRAMLRRVDDHFLSIARATSICGTLLSMNPATSMPRSGDTSIHGMQRTRNPLKHAHVITMKMPKILPPGKTSRPIMDHNTAQETTTINPRVK